MNGLVVLFGKPGKSTARFPARSPARFPARSPARSTVRSMAMLIHRHGSAWLMVMGTQST